MIKISHEVPLCLLESSRQFNDYDYALVHLFEQNREYYNFYKESLKQGRQVLLDNSIFELEEAFDEDKFAFWIKELLPTEYIIPDSLENKEKTLSNLFSWLNKYNTLPGKKIGVIQGKTYSELVECYKVINEHCDKIAISFDYSYYTTSFPHPNKHVSWMLGRVKLLGDLVKDGIINENKEHHLLGNSLPIEGKFYSNYKWISSMDTSNPVVHAIKNIRYEPNFGLYSKESQKLNDLIHTPYDTIDKELVKFNVSEFSKYWKESNFK